MHAMKYASALFAAAALVAQPVAGFAQAYPAGTTPPAATTVAPGATGQPAFQGGHEKGERHPEIHRAMKRLEDAKADLLHAAPDYDGHRGEAIKLIDQAEQQHMALEDAH
jgi:hypothetical protein